MRVLVTGSRTWDDLESIESALDDLLMEHDELTVVHGACPSGADAMASAWCRERVSFWTNKTITEERHPANWRYLGKRAGPVRNQHMVNLGADLCLAFIRGGSAGASHTRDRAREAGIEVREYTE